jgi:AraC-like DNA-binding protein
VKYREYGAPNHLAPWIECVWVLQGRIASGTESEQRVLPDGCPELILHFGDRVLQDGAHQPRYLVAGQMDRCLLLSPHGSVDVVGVRFHPEGARAFLRHPMSLLTNRFVELESVVGSAATRELEAAGEVARERHRLEKIWCFLERRVSGIWLPDAAVTHAVRLFVAAEGGISVDRLSDQLGISVRQLDRLFADQVGVPPKLFAQILRFQHVFRAWEQQDWPRLADLAVECGFFDQAHLCHVFQRFSGLSPSGFFVREEVMARLFTRARRSGLSDSYKRNSRQPA